MRIAYLLFAYKNPRLIKKEVQALESANSGFYLHIDRKVPLNRFSEILGASVDYIEDRIKVHWAEFSGVRAILSLMRRALLEPDRYEYLVLLSGSEYPLQHVEYIENFFLENAGAEFMDLVSIPNLPAGKPSSHIDTYCPPSTQPIRRVIAKAMTRCGLFRRNFRNRFVNLTPYGGHTWWALTRDAVQYIVHYSQKHPSLIEYFENVPQPEETFFHTILGNSEFRERIRCSLVYEDWSAGGSHPAMIKAEHISRFEKAEKVERDDVFGSGEVLFARKFSDDTIDLANRIDAKIRSSRA